MYQGIIKKYQHMLPVEKQQAIVSLCEGATPLIRLNNLADIIGHDIKLWAKFEGLNPTGSFKDRGMTMAVTKALESGAHSIICASTGNTSASAAAYAAKAKLKCFVVIPGGQIAYGKLAQALMYGAQIIQIEDNFDVGMNIVKQIANEGEVVLVNSVNPYRLQGQKTAAFEIVEALGFAPDYHCLPVGNAGNITAHWIGYCEVIGHPTKVCKFCKGQCTYTQNTLDKSRPKMIGYQAAGSAPFVNRKLEDNPQTLATAIRIGHPQSWDQAWQVAKESGGWFEGLDDGAILAAQKLLAEKEGIFCEPASAASIAGVIKDAECGKIEQGSRVVCTLTGNGLKDTQTAIDQMDIKQYMTQLNSSDIQSFKTLINQ